MIREILDPLAGKSTDQKKKYWTDRTITEMERIADIETRNEAFISFLAEKACKEPNEILEEVEGAAAVGEDADALFPELDDIVMPRV